MNFKQTYFLANFRYDLRPGIEEFQNWIHSFYTKLIGWSSLALSCKLSAYEEPVSGPMSLTRSVSTLKLVGIKINTIYSRLRTLLPCHQCWEQMDNVLPRRDDGGGFYILYSCANAICFSYWRIIWRRPDVFKMRIFWKNLLDCIQFNLVRLEANQLS